MITSPPRSAAAHRRAEATPYVDLTREEWSAARQDAAALTAEEVEQVRGLGDVIDLDEVRDIYLPLSRLLNLYVGATANLRGALNTFLGEKSAQRGTPFVIGVAYPSPSASPPSPGSSRHCSPAGPSTRAWSGSPPTGSSCP